MVKYSITGWMIALLVGLVCVSAGADIIRVGPGWHPPYCYPTIQEGIQAAQEGDTVLVAPGVYYEEVDFLGKAITVRGDNSAATINGGGGFAVVTMSEEGILQNFVITNGVLGILCFDGTPKVNLVTVVYNALGLVVLGDGSPQINSCIFRHNSNGDLDGADARYSCIQEGNPGEGNICMDPLFADAEGGDYHLRSRIGRFNPVGPGEPGWSEPVWLNELNGVHGDAAASPCLSADGLTIYFNRHIPALDHYCIVEAYRATPEGPFTSERVLTELSTTGYYVGAPWVSEDGLRLYYTENLAEGNRIKMAQRAVVGEVWTPVHTFYELHTNGVYGTQPALTADELTIVWHSGNRPGSAGGIDLWLATRPSMNEPFGNIRPIDEVNTSNHETSPYILADGLTLYFTAVDRNGYSGINTFKATRSSLNDTFGNEQLIEIPGYSEMNVSNCWVSSNEEYFYFENQTTGQGIFVSDYHEDRWVVDDETSPCIDGGDPATYPMDEPNPNGGRINMGAYGGTGQASKSERPWPNPCDINQDGRVDMWDFAEMSGNWLWTAPWI
ncbi:MAG: PD40 domain-containing protein [Sedimentisphaerales bacterium]|nr:PD40 domain-containing protein [Sedimentisphaerales bacterium]